MAAQAADKQNDELMTDLAGLFKMFSDPTRVKILNILLEGEKCVGDVAAQMNMSTAAVSHHLRMLRQGNLVTDHRQGKEVFYALADDHVTSILSLGTRRKRPWNSHVVDFSQHAGRLPQLPHAPRRLPDAPGEPRTDTADGTSHV